MKSTLKNILIIFILVLSAASLSSQDHKINSLQIDNNDYYPLYKILNILQLKRCYDVYTRQIIIRDKGRNLTFFIDDSTIYYEMQTILLKSPPIRQDGCIFIPKEMLDLITVWKRGGYLFSYAETDFNINKKQEVFYKGDKKQDRMIIKRPSTAIAGKKNKLKVKEPQISKADKFTEKPIQSASANRIRVIIIDPGHGGTDPGAIGQKGLREKEVVLKTCLYLRDYLKNKTRNIKIVMTRDTDVFIPLGTRTKIANKYINKNTAGLFLSVHANASYNKKTRGTETFVLSPIASDDEARAVAAMENGIIDRKMKKTDQISKILIGMMSYENIRESIQMAEFLQKSYVKKLKAKSTTPSGVKKALFYVLEGTLMPAALTEIGFLTNREEEKLLRTTSYKKKIAASIGEGLVKYINWYGANNGFIQ